MTPSTTAPSQIFFTQLVVPFWNAMPPLCKGIIAAAVVLYFMTAILHLIKD